MPDACGIAKAPRKFRPRTLKVAIHSAGETCGIATAGFAARQAKTAAGSRDPAAVFRVCRYRLML